MSLQPAPYDVSEPSTPEPGRPSDPAAQILISAATLAAVALAYGALAWLLSRSSTDNVAVMNQLAIVGYAGVVACAVAIRARDARRRTLALGTVVVGLACPLAVLVILGDPLDIERLRSLSWLLTASYLVLALAIVAAWGIARRHGSWWWLGLVPAAGINETQSVVAPWLVEVLPPAVWAVALTAYGTSMPVLGGAVCWLIDVLTTHPRRAHRPATHPARHVR